MLTRFILLLIMIGNFSSKAEIVDPTWDAVSEGFRQGNARILSNYLSNSIDLSILNSDKTLSKTQAVSELESFFNTNKPKSFNQVHQGNSKARDSYYCIGELETSNGKFRVYVYFKSAGASSQVQEIRIDKI